MHVKCYFIYTCTLNPCLLSCNIINSDKNDTPLICALESHFVIRQMRIIHECQIIARAKTHKLQENILT